MNKQVGAFLANGWSDAASEAGAEVYLVGFFNNFNDRFAVKFTPEAGWFVNRAGGEWHFVKAEDVEKIALDPFAYWTAYVQSGEWLLGEWLTGRLLAPTADQCDVLEAQLRIEIAQQPKGDWQREMLAVACARAGWRRNLGRVVGGPMFVSPNCDGKYYCVQLGRMVNGVRELFLNPAGEMIVAANVFGFALEQILAYPDQCYDQCVKEIAAAANRK